MVEEVSVRGGRRGREGFDDEDWAEAVERAGEGILAVEREGEVLAIELVSERDGLARTEGRECDEVGTVRSLMDCVALASSCLTAGSTGRLLRASPVATTRCVRRTPDELEPLEPGELDEGFAGTLRLTDAVE